jgi:hypothetical protein
LPIDPPAATVQLRLAAPPWPDHWRTAETPCPANANPGGGTLSPGHRPCPSRARRWAWLVVPIAAACWPGASAPGLAGEPKGPGSLAIERDLRAIRTRIDQAPRASSFDLDRVERDLWEHRLDAPDDPQILHVEREIRDLRHDADRHLERRSLGLRDLPAKRWIRGPIR